MWVWLRSIHLGVSPLCIVYAISFHSIAYARLYVSALCMPCYLVHCVCHFITLCMLSCILVAFHAYHAYCIVFGIGVSPGTGNEVRSVLRVTERVSIPQSPTLRNTHDGVGFCCIFICIHFILSCAIRLLGHHASICVIGGTRTDDYTPWRVVMHTYVKILCHAPLLLSVAANQKSAAFRSLTRIPRTIANRGKPGHREGFSAQGNPSMHHSSSGADLRQSLACMPIYCFPNLIC